MQPTQTAIELGSQVNPDILRHIGRPRTLLDLGCGAGLHGMHAASLGAHVLGVEADAELCERARRVLDEVWQLDPAQPEALHAALGSREFDVILVPTLLSQAAQPQALVSIAASHLTPGGRLIYALAASASSGLDAMPSALEDWARAAGLQLLERSQPSALRALISSSHWRALPVIEGQVLVARRATEPGPLSLTVGMLTMDEEPSVERMIGEIRRHAPDARILCVDSSLRDQTPFIAERLGARVLRQLPPRGHGPAMQLLMYEAARETDALIYLDCDFTYPAEYIPRIRTILASGADVVNAARTRSRPKAMPLANYLANKGFALCAQSLNGVKVSDLHSGMRGYRSSVIRDFAFDGEGDALPVDTLLWPARSGYRTVEIPIDYQERVGVSKLRKVTGTAWTFLRLARTLGVGARRNGDYEIWSSPEGPHS